MLGSTPALLVIRSCAGPTRMEDGSDRRDFESNPDQDHAYDRSGRSPLLAHACPQMGPRSFERRRRRCTRRAFNSPGRLALYMSEEFSIDRRRYEQDLGIRPGILCAYDVKSERIVDLADAQTLEALSFKTATLTSGQGNYLWRTRATSPQYAPSLRQPKKQG